MVGMVIGDEKIVGRPKTIRFNIRVGQASSSVSHALFRHIEKKPGHLSRQPGYLFKTRGFPPPPSDRFGLFWAHEHRSTRETLHGTVDNAALLAQICTHISDTLYSNLCAKPNVLKLLKLMRRIVQKTKQF
jgi:hypothetical protein